MPSSENAPSLLVVDDDPSMRNLLESAFTEQGIRVASAAGGEDAIGRVQSQAFDVIITDLHMPGKSGLDVLKTSKAVAPDTPVIIVTAYGTIETAVEAMRLGAYDFITKPFSLKEIELKVDKVIRQAKSGEGRWPKTSIHPSVRHLVGDSEHTSRLLNMIQKIGPSRSTVMITGPSGTGKELVARAIHDASPRRDKPFVVLNCAALAPGVLESELFGHEKGAFTGAVERRMGRFERAHEGTLFLDEVGEVDPAIQAKLLRVLQEGEFERVGGMETIKVDVRIVAATNRDLREAIERERFREDFYYRLNVFSIHVEPLRNRRDDIPALVDHFLRKYSVQTGKEVAEINDDVMEIFMGYSWPGNVRELENVVERAVVLAETGAVTINEIPPDLLVPPEEAERPAPREKALLAEYTHQLERELIAAALERFHWNKTKAAEHLGLKRTTLQYKIKKYHLE